MRRYVGFLNTFELSGAVVGSIIRHSRLGGMLRMPCGVSISGQQARNGDVFVEGFSMQAYTAQLDVGTFPGRRTQQPRKPRERNTNRPSVSEFNPHRVFVKSYAGCRSGHAMLLE